MGFVEASRTGGVLILTHRRNLVDQFNGELRRPRLQEARQRRRCSHGDEPDADGPVTVETYQWFVRNAGKVSDAYTIVICDEAHTALGEKTSAAIRHWQGPVFVGMTATGALIARHVTDLFPTQTSRFDLAQAARRGVIAPLRCVRIPPGVGVRSIAKVPLRKGEVDQDFDQEELAALLDQAPFNLAVADLYKVRFKDLPGVVYAAGVRHAHNVAEAFQAAGLKAKAVSGRDPEARADPHPGRLRARRDRRARQRPAARRGLELAARHRLHAPRARPPRGASTSSAWAASPAAQPGKEAGIVVDFVHPATTNDDPVVTLHSLLDRDVYRGGAIVVGPVRRGRGRRLRVERRVLPVTADPERRAQVFERELWRIAVEHLSWDEQHVWAALAGARVASNNWRRAQAMLHFDDTGELRRRFLHHLPPAQPQRPAAAARAQEVGSCSDPEAFDEAVEIVGGWSRDERREGVKVLLQALAERPIGRRDQATRWLWHLAEYTREVHEEYAVAALAGDQAAARPARQLVGRRARAQRAPARTGHAQAGPPPVGGAARRRAGPHARGRGRCCDGARMRMARKPSALARELLRNFPKGRRRRGGRRRKRKGGGGGEGKVDAQAKQAQVQAGPERDAA